MTDKRIIAEIDRKMMIYERGFAGRIGRGAEITRSGYWALSFLRNFIIALPPDKFAKYREIEARPEALRL